MSDDDFASQNDPEASFRRGYQQGAYDALQAAPSMTDKELREWVDVTLAEWRYVNQVGNRDLRPPRPWLKRRSMALPWGLPRQP